MRAPAASLMAGSSQGMDAMQESNRTMGRDEIEQAIREIHPNCFGWAMACCRHEREEAEDVLQTSYLKALEGKATFNGSSSVKTWMFGVVRKTALERRRYALVRALRRRPFPEDHAGSAPDPEAQASDREAHTHLRTLLGRLSSRQRDLLHLVYYQELTIEEASEVLGISLGSARTHYERGKQRLRALLNGAGKP